MSSGGEIFRRKRLYIKHPSALRYNRLIKIVCLRDIYPLGTIVPRQAEEGTRYERRDHHAAGKSAATGAADLAVATVCTTPRSPLTMRCCGKAAPSTPTTPCAGWRTTATDSKQQARPFRRFPAEGPCYLRIGIIRHRQNLPTSSASEIPASFHKEHLQRP